MPSRRAAARDAWCLAKCVEFAALKHVKICRLLAKEDESVVRVSERLHGLQPTVGWVRRTMHAHSVRGTLVFGGCFGAPQQLLRCTCKLILSIRGEGMNQLKPHEQHDVPRDRHKSVRSPRDCRFVGGNLNAKGFPAQAEKSARTSL